MMKANPRILCVDDDPANLQLLEAMLEPRAYEVIQAKSGKETLEKIAEQRIDLVLLDVMMPEINGFDVCRLIKEDEQYRGIPIIMITALRSKEDRIRGIEAGVEDFISKPFDQEEVLARIKMLLKMKELNAKLRIAYTNLGDLTSFGGEIIKSFNPFHFDFIDKIDRLVCQVIRQNADMAEKPRQVIVAILGETKKWEWYQYQFILNKLQRHPLKLDLQHHLELPIDNPQVVFYNKADLEKSEILPIIRKLESIPIRVSNMVCYLSPDLCFLAVNYGGEVTSYEASVLNSLVMQSQFLKSIAKQIQEIEDAFAYAVYILANAAEAHDEDTGNHLVRVGEYSALIAKKLGMPEAFVKTIRLQAQMHDVGKIQIPARILRNPGKLNPEEWEEMKKHSLYGAKILGDHQKLKMGKAIALSHHEWWNGKGYPNGFAEKDIPLPGRICAVADIFDALTNDRPYRQAFSNKEALEMLEEIRAEILDPELSDLFLGNFKEVVAIQEEGREDSWEKYKLSTPDYDQLIRR